MRLPWIQLTEEAWEKAEALSGALPRVDPARALGMLARLWRWGLSLGPSDQPPTGVLIDPLARKLMAGACGWRQDPELLAQALRAIGVVELSPDGLRVKGTNRYHSAWKKNNRRASVDPPETAGDENTALGGETAGEPEPVATVSPATGDGLAPKPEPQSKSERKKDTSTTEDPSTSAVHKVVGAAIKQIAAASQPHAPRYSDDEHRRAIDFYAWREDDRHERFPQALPEPEPPGFVGWYLGALKVLGGDLERLRGAVRDFHRNEWASGLQPPAPWRVFAKKWREYVPGQTAGSGASEVRRLKVIPRKQPEPAAGGGT